MYLNIQIFDLGIMKEDDIHIRLVSKEGEVFIVKYCVVCFSKTLKSVVIQFKKGHLEDLKIHLNNIETKILAKVIEYCKSKFIFSLLREKLNNDNFDRIKRQYFEWLKEFLKINKYMIVQLILAAAYLEIECLLVILIQTITEILSSKNRIELEKYLRIKQSA
nr:SKP1-like protein [Cryptomonas sp.]